MTSLQEASAATLSSHLEQGGFDRKATIPHKFQKATITHKFQKATITHKFQKATITHKFQKATITHKFQKATIPHKFQKAHNSFQASIRSILKTRQFVPIIKSYNSSPI